MSERDPLLEWNQPGESASDQISGKQDGRPGPLEISRSTRRGILAGLWTATFLSVGCISMLQFIVLTLP